MSTILPYLINWLQEFGYPALWLVVFVASVGAPLPISLVLLALVPLLSWVTIMCFS